MLEYPNKIIALVPQATRAFLRELKRVPIRAINFTLSRYTDLPATCPCCDHKTFLWLDYDKSYPQSICPKCNSHPRHRLLQLYLEKETDLFHRTQKILHVAPEKIFQRKFQSMPHLDYVTIDISGRRVDFSCDVSSLPFANETFDVILCNHVLEHVEDDHTAMKELFRVLKPGGWAMLNVPIDTSNPNTFEDSSIKSAKDRKRYYWQEDHKRLYGMDYKSKIVAAGFQVEVKEFAKSQSDTNRNKYNLNIYEDLYIGKKFKRL